MKTAFNWIAVCCMAAFLSGFAMGKSACAAEAEWWGVATVRSYHTQRGGRDYNEQNYGLGVEYRSGDGWGVSAGWYNNSYYNTSVYAGVTFGLAQFGPAKVGACACAVTGYSDTIRFVVVPSVSFEGKQWGVNIGVLPAVIGLQVKHRFN